VGTDQLVEVLASGSCCLEGMAFKARDLKGNVARTEIMMDEDEDVGEVRGDSDNNSGSTNGSSFVFIALFAFIGAVYKQ